MSRMIDLQREQRAKVGQMLAAQASWQKLVATLEKHEKQQKQHAAPDCADAAAALAILRNQALTGLQIVQVASAITALKASGNDREPAAQDALAGLGLAAALSQRIHAIYGAE